MTIAAQSNFQVVYSLMAAPGQCGNCGYSGSDRRYIDTHRDFEYYGVLYYCEVCVADMANQFGWITPDKAAEKDALAEIQASELVLLRTKLAATEAYIGAALNLTGGAINSIGSGPVPHSNVGDPVSVEAQPDTGGVNSEAAVIADEPRPDDVSGVDDSSLADFDL